MTCPHGLVPATCEICRVLGVGPGPDTPATTAGRPAAGPGRRLPAAGAGLVAAGIGLVVAVLVAAQLLAAASVVLRFVQLLAVAAVAGWLGFKLGVLSERYRR